METANARAMPPPVQARRAALEGGAAWRDGYYSAAMRTPPRSALATRFGEVRAWVE